MNSPKVSRSRKNYGLELPTLAMEVALSPIRHQELDSEATDASPMVINMTPTTEQDGGEEAMKDHDSGQQYEKPPPLHTGADWKIVLHLPEIETWLRMTSERVRDLTYSVQQDSDSKHVDVHLVQLKFLPKGCHFGFVISWRKCPDALGSYCTFYSCVEMVVIRSSLKHAFDVCTPRLLILPHVSSHLPTLLIHI
ncbi:A-kinase anchor protein 6-like [Rhineura floridana]|uniref:A-kinase anchor protein 6-like n=1 Tax=Rhineura floridana TaxID=261503 RepID=UPI002AC879D9|nr:A-kinase anchor protein 6-like [Rhineura floridana]